MVQTEMNRKKVLIIDDEPLIGRVCERLLAPVGFTVKIAQRADIALEMLNEEEFDACLLDVRMPGMSGIEFHEHIKEFMADFSRKVIFMTGDVLSQRVADYLKKNNKLYLVKPFCNDDLV